MCRAWHAVSLFVLSLIFTVGIVPVIALSTKHGHINNIQVMLLPMLVPLACAAIIEMSIRGTVLMHDVYHLLGSTPMQNTVLVTALTFDASLLEIGFRRLQGGSSRFLIEVAVAVVIAVVSWGILSPAARSFRFQLALMVSLAPSFAYSTFGLITTFQAMHVLWRLPFASPISIIVFGILVSMQIQGLQKIFDSASPPVTSVFRQLHFMLRAKRIAATFTVVAIGLNRLHLSFVPWAIAATCITSAADFLFIFVVAKNTSIPGILASPRLSRITGLIPMHRKKILSKTGTSKLNHR